MEPFWKQFLLYYARQSNRGAVRTGSGVEAAWAHSALLVNNGTYLTGPVADAADLRRRCREAEADANPFGLPWLFFLYEPLLHTQLLPEADDVFASDDYHRAATLRVMHADTANLTAPLRPLLQVELRRAETPNGVKDCLDLNCLAYGMPLEITQSVMEAGIYFRDPVREFGYVAYAGGEPVSTTAVLVIGDVLYVELVATSPAHQKKGYAEAVMRHALAEASRATGLHKTALDASEMGRPLYAQMGYREGPAWRYYIKAE